MRFAAFGSAGLAASLSRGCRAFSPAVRPKLVAPFPLAASAEDGAAAALLDSPAAASASAANESEEKSLTQRIMESTSNKQAGGAGGASTWDAFLRTEANWERLRSSEAFDYDPTRLGDVDNAPRKFVTDDGAEGNPECWAKLRAAAGSGSELDYDVTICGGTLGIFIGAALQRKGHRVAVIEAGKLMGREQEWNISQKELDELVELGVLTEEDLAEATKTEFPGCRAGFKNREGERMGAACRLRVQCGVSLMPLSALV